MVPILIENTQPKGAYLYELADRNWIQAWPDPTARIEELVEHLVALAGQPRGRRRCDGEDRRPRASRPTPGAGAAAPAAANDELVASPRARIRAPMSARPANSAGRNPGADAQMTLPLPMARPDSSSSPWRAALAWYLKTQALFADVRPGAEYVSIGFALPYAGWRSTARSSSPFRYYLRPAVGRWSAGEVSDLDRHALLLSCGAVVVLLACRGIISTGTDQARSPEFFGVSVGVFTVIAFVIYGVLAGQRAMTSFRSNIKKIWTRGSLEALPPIIPLVPRAWIARRTDGATRSGWTKRSPPTMRACC